MEKKTMQGIELAGMTDYEKSIICDYLERRPGSHLAEAIDKLAQLLVDMVRQNNPSPNSDADLVDSETRMSARQAAIAATQILGRRISIADMLADPYLAGTVVMGLVQEFPKNSNVERIGITLALWHTGRRPK